MSTTTTTLPPPHPTTTIPTASPPPPSHDPQLTDHPSPHNHHASSPPSDPDPDLDTRKHTSPPRNAAGKMICPRPGCESLTFDRKCEWSKHIDKHDRPYRCTDPMCRKLKGFTYSGGLLRHQREVHKAHGGPKDTLNCPIPYCKRNHGPGFTRRENLNEHIRRVHRHAVPDEVGGGSVEVAVKRVVGPKRRKRGAAGVGVGVGAERVGAGGAEMEEVPVPVPVAPALMDGSLEAAAPAPQANMQSSTGDHHHHHPVETLPGGPNSVDDPDPRGPLSATHIHLHHQHHHQQPPAHTSPAETANGVDALHASHIPAEFQVQTQVLTPAEYELAVLRQEMDKLRRELQEKDERIRALEAGR